MEASVLFYAVLKQRIKIISRGANSLKSRYLRLGVDMSPIVFFFIAFFG